MVTNPSVFNSFENKFKGMWNVGVMVQDVYKRQVVMLDVKAGVSEGKAMDMMQTAQLLGFDTTLVGCTNDYAQRCV